MRRQRRPLPGGYDQSTLPDRTRTRACGYAISLIIIVAALRLPAAQPAAPVPLEVFFQAASHDDNIARPALARLTAAWKNSYTSMLIDMARLMRRAPRAVAADDPPLAADDDRGTAAAVLGTPGDSFPSAVVPRESIVRARLIRFLEKQTGKRFDETLNGWREWMWTLPYDPHPDYGVFKGQVYGQIDQRMRGFFPPGVRSLIRLDEIDWGGVVVNGIPPLRYPKVLTAGEARYLRDSHIVFGVTVNGEARAYPKRILAWHEMAIDRVGGVELTVVYCTLCGTVIPYESTVGGQIRRFGTSGLLYRSNKLMFDEETGSLWSTLDGKPVVGTLVDSGFELTPREVVTTTWGEWRALHPHTTVLSLETGHRRDYSEGAAYREYFASDDLYFRVSQVDKRLKNKSEVLVMRVKARVGGALQAVAIDAKFLERNPVFHFEVEGRRLVAVTSRRGANRVYDVGSQTVAFTATPGEHVVVDSTDRKWRVTEEALVRQDDETVRLPRTVAQRAFWFGWFAQFPDTLLIK